jgi:hypothetical protein
MLCSGRGLKPRFGGRRERAALLFRQGAVSVTGSDEAIARLIVAPGEDPPPWLVAALDKARSTLAWIIRQERVYPGRKELRLRLETLAAAIDFVRREVGNPDMAELLRSGDKALLYERETYQGLGDLG